MKLIIEYIFIFWYNIIRQKFFKGGFFIMKKGNVIVGQSGGPTSVINSSLAGVFKAAKDNGVDKIYGMRNGIQGLLENKYVDLKECLKDGLDIELLKRTPSSYLGSCRFKLPEISENEKLFKDIFAILEKLDVKYFFYIGGNDSMDTTKKLSEYAKSINSDIRFMGVPKTIDNDLAVTDHTPGYGSAAKYIGSSIKEIIRDGLVYNYPSITVVEIMGRNAGWLTAAASLAKSDDCEGVDMICLPEVPFDVDKFLAKIEANKNRSQVVAISEGIKTKDGKYVCEASRENVATDSFGHKSLSGTSQYLAELIKEKTGCKTRSVEFSSLQRCASHIASRTDVEEAFIAGSKAVEAAFNGETGKVVIFERISTEPYQMITKISDVDKIANVEKKVPLEWIINDGTDVSDALTDYIKPLIQGEMTQIMVNGLPKHIVLK